VPFGYVEPALHACTVPSLRQKYTKEAQHGFPHKRLSIRVCGASTRPKYARHVRKASPKEGRTLIESASEINEGEDQQDGLQNEHDKP